MYAVYVLCERVYPQWRRHVYVESFGKGIEMTLCLQCMVEHLIVFKQILTFCSHRKLLVITLIFSLFFAPFPSPNYHVYF